ncbi:sra stem-loop-interacting RNA-binding protein, mitochondrial [Plakobranchus ocellatus]|uniref:Sra stem-loop-interacting RNA-binding protein, mitochondrial n=1 Tax=Plakobranchus ocellatus TaxID=259542 RepID=A0AAV4BPU7_9GAST|nr:sra stem-loop-interacting RNA-binding protein, mitochondrial [Plakobranchus ocellatus]
MSRIQLAVTNIGWACMKSDLRAYFRKFGTVLDVHIPMNYETGFNKNIAFLYMKEGFSNDLLQDFHVIDGQEVTVKVQANRRSPRTNTNIPNSES